MVPRQVLIIMGERATKFPSLAIRANIITGQTATVELKLGEITIGLYVSMLLPTTEHPCMLNMSGTFHGLNSRSLLHIGS